MSDHRSWRLVVRLSKHSDDSGVDRGATRARPIVAELSAALPSDVFVEETGAGLVVRAFKNAQIEHARAELDVILSRGGHRAVVRVAHRAGNDGDWAETTRPYQAPRSRHAGRPKFGSAGERPLLSRRAKFRWLVGMIVAAVAGATYYALSPGVASYQLGFVFVLPLLVVVLLAVHRRIPIRLQWVIATLLAIAGPIAYVIFGGSQWWAWSQTAAVPFVLLVIARGVSLGPRGVTRQPWSGGPMDGPWGPP